MIVNEELITGASFTGTITTVNSLLSSLKGSVMFLEMATRVIPGGISSVPSQATNVSVTLPIASLFGTNLTKLSIDAFSNRASVKEVLSLMSVQPGDGLSLNCQ